MKINEKAAEKKRLNKARIASHIRLRKHISNLSLPWSWDLVCPRSSRM